MVLMPEYLKTLPIQNSSKPRIISEVKKNCLTKLKLSFTTSFQDNGKTKFSGRLLWNIKNSEWIFRTGEVKQGSLVLINKETSVIDLKLLLRGLNLLQCNTPRTFCLVEAKGITFYKFQALTETDYEKWVKVLAVELIRQTPFQNIRFLDILSIVTNNEYDKNNTNSLKKDGSEECIPKITEISRNTSESKWEHSMHSNFYNQNGKNIKFNLKSNKDCLNEGKLIKVEVKTRKSLSDTAPYFGNNKIKSWMRTQSMNNLVLPKVTSDESENSSGDENIENFCFVPVRERKKFFESLNSSKKEIQRSESSPLVKSSSIGNTNILFNGKLYKRKRTKSLHDLQKIPVKEIRELFEPKDRMNETIFHPTEMTERKPAALLTEKLLKKGERKLEKLQNQTAEVKENMKIVMDDLESIEPIGLKRKEDLELYSALRRRLDEEKLRLERLKDEKAKVLKDNLRIINKLEKSNRKR